MNDLESINKTELVQILIRKGIRAHRGVPRKLLLRALEDNEWAKAIKNPIDRKREVIIAFIERNWSKIRSQLELKCKGNCYEHNDVQVLACWNASKGELTKQGDLQMAKGTDRKALVKKYSEMSQVELIRRVKKLYPGETRNFMKMGEDELIELILDKEGGKKKEAAEPAPTKKGRRKAVEPDDDDDDAPTPSSDDDDDDDDGDDDDSSSSSDDDDDGDDDEDDGEAEDDDETPSDDEDDEPQPKKTPVRAAKEPGFDAEEAIKALDDKMDTLIGAFTQSLDFLKLIHACLTKGLLKLGKAAGIKGMGAAFKAVAKEYGFGEDEPKEDE